MVVGIVDATHEPRALGSVDETDRRVVTQQELVRDVADRRSARITVTAYREHQLVLRG